MLTVSGMDHLNIRVKNLDKTISFYSKLFGFEIKETGIRSGRKYAIIGKSGIAFLAAYEADELPEMSSERGQFLNHIGFNVENFDSVKSALSSSGVELDLEYDYPSSRSIYITDPNGIEIELSEKFGGAL